MRAMVAPWQHVIPFARAGIGRGVSAGRRLPRQGDYDLAVDDLDAIGTGSAGGLERSRERWLSLPAFRRRGARADDKVAGDEVMNVRGIVCHCCFFRIWRRAKIIGSRRHWFKQQLSQ
jgi:hypothetical protein